MVKKYKKEGDRTILIIMIITFIVTSLLLLFFINYLDQLYKETERYRTDSGELGSIGIWGTCIFFVILFFFMASGTYLFLRIIKKVNRTVQKEIGIKNK